MLIRSFCIAMACAVCAALPARAHHSHNNYDTATWTTMEGVVTEVHRLVPHSWIYMDVKDAATGCLLGFVTPMHGDAARGHGVEKDWDGGGGAGFPTASPYVQPAK